MSENKRIFLSHLTLDIQPGVGLSSGQGSDPVVMLRYSTDAGYTWSNQRNLSIGKIGKYSTQVESWRFGYGRNFVLELSGSDPNVIGLLDMYVEAEQGRS